MGGDGLLIVMVAIGCAKETAPWGNGAEEYNSGGERGRNLRENKNRLREANEKGKKAEEEEEGSWNKRRKTKGDL